MSNLVHEKKCFENSKENSKKKNLNFQKHFVLMDKGGHFVHCKIWSYYFVRFSLDKGGPFFFEDPGLVWFLINLIRFFFPIISIK